MSGRTTRRRVLRVTLPGEGRPGGSAPRADFLAGEEPLGIRVDGVALTMTMRTPSKDLELAAGFLVSEAVIRSPADIAEIKLCDGKASGHADHDGMGNIADVALAPGVIVTPGARRNFLTTSACGICGKTSIEDICVLPHAPLAADTARFAPETLAALPDRLRDAQRVFSRTGGLHAAGLFTADGELIAVREDVGRHNAVDKVVGWALLGGRLPLAGCSARQRPRLVRIGPEGRPGGHPAARRCLRAVLARRRPSRAGGPHPGRFPARPVDERLQRSPPAIGLSVLNVEHAAGLLGLDRVGGDTYKAMLTDSLWGIDQMMGKLNSRLYVLSR